MNQIPNADPQNHLSKVIEAYRVHVFDIVTQYKAIFTDDEQFNLYLSDSGVEEDDQRLDSALFYNWVNNKIGEFLEILKNDLARGATSFDTILSQCMYFGLSFSRVGTDFRPLMVPIILDAIKSKFESHCTRAKEQLRSTLVQFSVSDIAETTDNEQPEAKSTGCFTVYVPPKIVKI